jgi:hypothetical protein
MFVWYDSFKYYTIMHGRSFGTYIIRTISTVFSMFGDDSNIYEISRTLLSAPLVRLY